MLKVWIVGSNGQMGTALNEIIDPTEMRILNTDVDELDVTKTDEVLQFGELNRPDIIINCAVIKDIAYCEQNPERAFLVNALGARNLCLVARKMGAKMVQLSTDDVFDGRAEVPYTEFDQTNPITIYGKSKRAGEHYVKEFTHKHFIIRSNWVYGKGENFVTELIEAAKKQQPIAVSTEHFASPTSAKDLARLLLHLMKTNEYGTYHATCKGVCSRYQFAEEILRLTHLSTPFVAVDQNQCRFSVDRPANAHLDNFILRTIELYQMPTWQESLKEYIAENMEALHNHG